MGFEDDRRRSYFKELRMQAVRTYIAAVRAERNNAPDQLVGAQALLDFQDAGIPLITSPNRKDAELDDSIALPVEFKGFRYFPNYYLLESDFHDKPIPLLPSEEPIVLRFLRSQGRMVGNGAFLHHETGILLPPDSIRTSISQLREKLHDHIIEVDGTKTRRFIHTVRNRGYRFDPVEFRAS